jgi:hypothetical protein
MKSNALLNLSLVAILGTIPIAGGQTPELDLDRVTELLDAGINVERPEIPGIPDIPDIPPIAQHFDYGDAPDPSYPTLHANDGARHFVAPSADGFLLTLGSRIDTEKDGQPTLFATGDDAFGPFDDEDGVSFLSPLQPGGMAEIEVWASGPGRLDAWVDFNGNGSWMDPGEQVFAGEPVAANLNTLSITVPTSTLGGVTYARFRLSSQGMLAPVGTAQDGEVEDYLIEIEGGLNPDPETDWGDAPSTYPVTAANSGAFHLLTNDLMLGTSVDSEPDGIPGSSALRDDLDSAVDDEDGITFTSAILTGGNTTLQAVASMPGRIDAWVDFNADGDWNDVGEQVFVGYPVVAGVNNMNFLVPGGASTGGTYARFRISSGGGLGTDGVSSDGEVEDYQIGIDPGQLNGELDWGDAPAPYPTLAADGGAVHVIANGIYLGAMCDPEGDGQPGPMALGDDNNGMADEDGVAFTTLQQGAASVVSVVASAPGYINAFLDFNGDGVWGAGEQIVLNAAANVGINSYSFTVPSSASTGHTVARVRINSTGGLGPSGYASDGEVEDHLVYIKANQPPVFLDWGDAPKPFPTLQSNPPTVGIGASHQIDDLFLGQDVDSEPNGQPSMMSLGDDLDGNDDDDGVIFLTPMISGSYALVRVLPTMTGILDAWVDFDGDGTWAQPNNRIFNSETVNPGQVLAFKVPKLKKPLKTAARFRLSHGGSSYTGHQVGGEVEDYHVKIGKMWKWKMVPNLEEDRLVVLWNTERGMNYTLETTASPQAWIRDNLGEHEVPRVDELFPTGVAWKEAAQGELSEGAADQRSDDGNSAFPMSEWRAFPDLAPVIESRPGLAPQVDATTSAHVSVDRSKKMALFRVIAMPE